MDPTYLKQCVGFERHGRFFSGGEGLQVVAVARVVELKPEVHKINQLKLIKLC